MGQSSSLVRKDGCAFVKCLVLHWNALNHMRSALIDVLNAFSNWITTFAQIFVNCCHSYSWLILVDSNPASGSVHGIVFSNIIYLKMEKFPSANWMHTTNTRLSAQWNGKMHYLFMHSEFREKKSHFIICNIVNLIELDIVQSLSNDDGKKQQQQKKKWSERSTMCTFKLEKIRYLPEMYIDIEVAC